MYFESFDSYTQSIGTAETFCVVIHLRDGTTVSSSLIPVEAIQQVQRDICTCEETNGWLTVWDRHRMSLSSVPSHQIKLVQINLTRA